MNENEKEFIVNNINGASEFISNRVRLVVINELTEKFLQIEDMDPRALQILAEESRKAYENLYKVD